LYPLDETKPRDLLHHADLALYAAKANKATRTEYYVLYDPSVVQDATPLGWLHRFSAISIMFRY
ncbi:MAG: hypothetical protein ACYCYL_10460, partial [Acidithiobacillus sp.]